MLRKVEMVPERNIPAEQLAAFAAKYPGIARLAQTCVVPCLADLARQAVDREEESVRAKMLRAAGG